MSEIQIETIVTRFFRDFSRLEYALKRAGYVKPRGNSIDAQVDWSRFANCHADSFNRLLEEDANISLKKSVEFMRCDPPRKLVMIQKDGNPHLCWKRADPAGNTLKELLVLVCRVRNNLFHGEKPETVIGGSKRGRELIEKSLKIITTCVSLDDQVKNAFEQYTHPPVPRCDSDS